MLPNRGSVWRRRRVSSRACVVGRRFVVVDHQAASQSAKRTRPSRGSVHMPRDLVLDLGEPSFGVDLAAEALRPLAAGRITVAGPIAGLAAPHAALDVSHRYLLLFTLVEGRGA